MRSTGGNWAALAALLARGYLRLTQTVQNSAVSGARKGQKPLDVSAPESGDVDDQTPDRRPRWRAV